MKQALQVGIITSTHGVRGEVKVFPTTDDPRRFRKLRQILLETEKEQAFLEIESVRFFKQYVILKFRGIDSMDEAERYKGASLLVRREDAVKLQKDEYFIADLIGMAVETDDGKKGILKDVLQTGANEVYVIELEEIGEILVPAIRQCILNVDVEHMQMKIHLMKGLI